MRAVPDVTAHPPRSYRPGSSSVAIGHAHRWALGSQDLRQLPLLERKRRLREIMPRIDCRLLYLDHIRERGRALFDAVCADDHEGIVAKWTAGTYQTDGRSTSWLKIKNPDYSRMRDRHELFETRRGHRVVGRRSLMPALRLI